MLKPFSSRCQQRAVEIDPVKGSGRLVDARCRVGCLLEDTKNGERVKCSSYNGADSIDEKYNNAEVLQVSVTKYNTFDIEIEKPTVVKTYTVRFEIPSWIDLDEDVEIVFEDDEEEYEIQDRIEEAFNEWLDNKIEELRGDATSEIRDIDEEIG